MQGWLASAKQRDWWKKNAPEQLYKYDYLAALAMHSISWSFMILLPIAVSNGLNVGVPFLLSFIGNASIHGFVDNLKANRKKINLIQDQTIHVIQIVVSYFLLVG